MAALDPQQTDLVNPYATSNFIGQQQQQAVRRPQHDSTGGPLTTETPANPYSSNSTPNVVSGASNHQDAIEQTTSSVELSISCSNLPDCDIVTKSDPQVFVYLLDFAGRDKACLLGQTEVIADNLNPKFARKILMQYHFEQIQRLRFEVYDIDPIGGNDFLGALDTTLADIVTARGSTFKRALVGGPRKKPGQLIVDVEELTACKQVIMFNLVAHDLSGSFCGTFAPSTSVYIYRSNENGALTIVYRSLATKCSASPKFAEFTQKLVTLCNGDCDRTIRFELIDRRFKMERELGFFETTVNALKANRHQASVFHLVQHKPRLTGSQTKSTGSSVVLSHFRIMKQATFFDYIRAGAQIHFVISIDFTASNGDPNYPESLHYLDPMRRRLNAYEEALVAVGNIIRPYDTQGLFAGFGFGAKLHGPNQPPAHLFPLNGNDQHPYVTSIEQLLQVYRTKLKCVTLSGPTNFAPCIAHCDNIAKQFEDGNHYFVLLIVTDGIISDMQQTRRAIVEASTAPLSIIICGVGNADFGAMNELDSDDSVMIVDGKQAERDIVQFVPMNQFIGPQVGAAGAARRPSSVGRDSLLAQKLLAEEVLREIPDQLTGYMIKRGFHPELTYDATST